MSGARGGEERFLSGYAGRMFLVLTLGSMGARTGQYVLPALLPAIIDDLSITSFEAGIALSVMTVFMAAVQYPSGRLSDQLSRKTILVASLGLTLAGFAVLMGTPAYAGLLVGTATFGAGAGLYPSAARAALSDIYRARRGQAFGLHLLSVDVGGILASGLAIVVLSAAVWRAAFAPLFVLVGLILLLTYRWSRERVVLARASLEVVGTARRLFADPRIRWLIVAYSLFVFTWQGVLGFLPTYLQVEVGAPPTVANAAFAVLFATGLVAKPIAGRLSDRLPRPAVAAGALVLGVAGLGLLVGAPTLALIVAGVAVYAAGHKSFGPVIQAYFMDVFPDENRGGDYGAVRTVFTGVSSLGPAYVGFVASRADYTTAYAGLVATLAASAAIVLWVSRRG